MCDSWKVKSSEELSGQEWLKFFSELRSWLGPFYIKLTGGEPFMLNRINDLLDYFHLDGIKTMITTNGFLLSQRQCDFLIEKNLNFLIFSIDSRFADIHDQIRGRKGIFERAVKAVKYLRQNSKNINIGISSIIIRHNYNDLTNFARWALDIGADRVSFQPLFVNLFSENRRQINVRENPLYKIGNLEKLDTEIEGLIQLKCDGFPIWNTFNELELIKNYFHDIYSAVNTQGCFSGYHTLVVNSNGDAKLCSGLDVVIGNIRNTNIKDLWYSDTADRLRKSMKNCRRICLANCNRNYSIKEKLHMARLLFK
jgi:MoaA/NifB/PqqE/SkfB family radical SAM enzyme